MRIRNHRLAFLLLLCSALGILADDSPPLVPETTIDDVGENSDNAPIDLQDLSKVEQLLKENDEEDNHGSPIIQTTTSTPQQEEEIIDEEEETVEKLPKTAVENYTDQTETEPVARPKQEDNGENRHENEDAPASSIDNDESQLVEENRITKEYESSLTTKDGGIDDNEPADTKTDSNVESSENENEETEGAVNLSENSDESASQVVHEDGSRLPDLPKIDPIENSKGSDVETNQQEVGSSLNELPIERDDDLPILDEEIIRRQEPLESFQEKDAKHEILYENGHTYMEEKENEHEKLYKKGHIHMEMTGTTKEQGLKEVVTEKDDSETPSAKNTEEEGIEEAIMEGAKTNTETTKITKESEIEEVVINGNDSGTEISDSTKEPIEDGLEGEIRDTTQEPLSEGNSNVKELEKEKEEEVVILQGAKLSIGITSTKPIVEEGDRFVVDPTESDAPSTDKEVQVENIDTSSGTEMDFDGDSNNENESLSNIAEEIADGEAESSVAENIETVDDSSTTDVYRDDPINSDEEIKVDSSMRIAQDDDDDGDLDESVGDEEKNELEEEKKEEKEDGTEKAEEFKVDDDEDDEDLAERVSVDYASKSAGALIIEKTREFKGTSSLITGDRDKYAIVPCNEEKKHVVLSLSEDILVKEIKLANYERFSSTIKDFQVKGSHTLGKWVDLGTYQAKPGNGEQSFALETPAWARYLKFKFLTHHGNEYFCTLSQIKVHGSNMVQDFHEHWESIEVENNEEKLEGENPSDATEMYDTDEMQTSGTDATANDTVTGEKTEKNVSNSSIAREEEVVAPDGTASVEKGDAGPRHAQVTPSVHSKPRPLDQFRSHMTFSEIIQVEMGDEQLFSDLYNIIPQTLGSLPAHAKNDLTCNEFDHEMRSVHQIGRLAMDSLYRFGTSIVDDFVAGETHSSRISSSKMDDFSNEFYQKRFGSELSSLVHLYANNIVYPISPSYIEPTNTKNSDGNDELLERRLHEDGKGELSLTDGKFSAQSTTNLSIEGANASLDVAIQKLIKDLPSAECLVQLDFAEFKNKLHATRKASNASGGSQGGRMMEPIFKKLTDEIFALQTSLSVHDQFSKLSVGCYQRVILDLALETEKLRKDQDDRLRRLEELVLEPASMRMFQKLAWSLSSNVASWLISNGSYVLSTIKNVWIPKLLRYHLSKDTFDTLDEAYQTAAEFSKYATNVFFALFDYSSQAVKTLTKEVNSKGWTNTETYHEYLSAWSKYYDGGITVVFIVLTLLCLRLIMMCSWLFRPKKSMERRSLRSPRSSRMSSSNVNPIPEEGLYAPMSMTTKKFKKKSSKSKRRAKDPPTDAPIAEGTTTGASVPVVEDVANKVSEEVIPDLKEEPAGESPSSLLPAGESSSSQSTTPKNNIPSNRRENCPPANSPSVVSLDEQ